MSNVVSLCHFRAEREQNQPEIEPHLEDEVLEKGPLFEALIYPSREGDDEQFPVMFHLSDDLQKMAQPQRLREMADMLEDVVGQLRGAAHNADPENSDGQVMAQITLYSSSKIGATFHEGLNDANWLKRRLEQVLETNFADVRQSSVEDLDRGSGATSSS